MGSPKPMMKSQAQAETKIHKDMTKSVPKVGHLTHNIQCDIQARILDNLIFTLYLPWFQDSLLQWVPLMPSCSRESVGTAQFTCRMRLGTSKTLLLAKHVSSSLFDVPNSSYSSFDYVNKSERNSLIKQAMRNRNILRPILSRIHGANGLFCRICPGLNSLPCPGFDVHLIGPVWNCNQLL